MISTNQRYYIDLTALSQLPEDGNLTGLCKAVTETNVDEEELKPNQTVRSVARLPGDMEMCRVGGGLDGQVSVTPLPFLIGITCN